MNFCRNFSVALSKAYKRSQLVEDKLRKKKRAWVGTPKTSRVRREILETVTADASVSCCRRDHQPSFPPAPEGKTGLIFSLKFSPGGQRWEPAGWPSRKTFSTPMQVRMPLIVPLASTMNQSQPDSKVFPWWSCSFFIKIIETEATQQAISMAGETGRVSERLRPQH